MNKFENLLFYFLLFIFVLYIIINLIYNKLNKYQKNITVTNKRIRTSSRRGGTNKYYYIKDSNGIEYELDKSLYNEVTIGNNINIAVEKNIFGTDDIIKIL